MDASGAFSLAEREAGIARMVQRGVILTDYFAITVEMMRSDADPHSNEVYAALDMDFAVLSGRSRKRTPPRCKSRVDMGIQGRSEDDSRRLLARSRWRIHTTLSMAWI
jgi:hypothetical protein